MTEAVKLDFGKMDGLLPAIVQGRRERTSADGSASSTRQAMPKRWRPAL